MKIKSPFDRKKMNEAKETMQEHRDNEEVTPVTEPKSPEISPDVPDPDADAAKEGMNKLKADLSEMNDKFLRLYSEFDNYRKRTRKEQLDLMKFAGAEVITSLLPVLDDMERAMKFSNGDESKSSRKEGTELIFNKFRSILESKGLKRMNSIGEEFDVDLHEAISNVEAPSEDLKGKIIDEVECGYFLNDKVIRHAKVIVGI